MQKEAAEAGFYTSQDGSKYPRVQLLTIKDLLEGNKKVQRPLHVREVTFKKALTIKDLLEGNKKVQRPLHVREVTFKKAPRSRPEAATNLSLNLE